MKKATATIIAALVLLLVTFSMVQAGPSDGIASSWRLEFASDAAANGIDKATVGARASGKTVVEIIYAALAADFGDFAITVALLNAGTVRKEIIAAALEAGLNMEIVIAALNAGPGSEADEELGYQFSSNQALVHPPSPPVNPPFVSPSTF